MRTQGSDVIATPGCIVGEGIPQEGLTAGPYPVSVRPESVPQVVRDIPRIADFCISEAIAAVPSQRLSDYLRVSEVRAYPLYLGRGESERIPDIGVEKVVHTVPPGPAEGRLPGCLRYAHRDTVLDLLVTEGIAQDIGDEIRDSLTIIGTTGIVRRGVVFIDEDDRPAAEHLTHHRT